VNAPRALVLCEESGVWSEALWRRGFDVTQVDLALPPGWHRLDTNWVQVGADAAWWWDQASWFHVVLAFPPCDDLSAAGAHLWPGKDVYEALAFASGCAAAARGARVAGLVENPRGLLQRVLGRPSMVVNPWEYSAEPAENVKKRTCLWLNGWPPPFSLFSGSVSAAPFVDNVPGSRDQKRIRSRSWVGMAAAFVGSLVSSVRWPVGEVHPWCRASAGVSDRAQLAAVGGGL
jgi:hypothetical protein